MNRCSSKRQLSFHRRRSATAEGRRTHLDLSADRVYDVQPLAGDCGVQPALEVSQLAVPLDAVADDAVLDIFGHGLVGGFAGAELCALDGSGLLLLAFVLLLGAHGDDGELACALVGGHHGACCGATTVSWRLSYSGQVRVRHVVCRDVNRVCLLRWGDKEGPDTGPGSLEGSTSQANNSGRGRLPCAWAADAAAPGEGA